MAIYSHEDRFALHRFKADEAYQIGKPGEPIRSYLDIDSIVDICQRYKVDAVHPGYGFFVGESQIRGGAGSRGSRLCGPVGPRRWRTWVTR